MNSVKYPKNSQFTKKLDKNFNNAFWYFSKLETFTAQEESMSATQLKCNIVLYVLFILLYIKFKVHNIPILD